MVPTNKANEGFRASHIYCYSGNITVPGATLQCPPYVFRVENSLSWNITGKNYIASQENIRIQNILGIESYIQVPATKTSPEGLTIFDALERIQYMQGILDKFDPETLELTNHTRQIVTLNKHNKSLDLILQKPSAC